MTARPVLAALAALCLAALAGCRSDGGATSGAGATVAPNPERSALVARAGLDRCPRSTADVAEHGLPDVTLPCLGDGPAVHLAGLRGRPTVVNIWGSWCGPCQKEAPYLQRAYADLKPRVGFLGVDTVDDPDSALDFAAHVTPPMKYPSVVDDDKKVLLAVGGSLGPPMTVFVDASGVIVHTKFGEYTGVDDLRADIARYLGVAG